MTLEAFLKEWHNDNPRLLVHTSGSTGAPQPLWVEKRRMEASARITCQFLGLKRGDTALLCLPLDYIAGKMMVVRAEVAGLHLISVQPSGHPLSLIGTASEGQCDGDLPVPIDFAAMVPLQVYNSLQVPEERERLLSVRHLIIGGGAVDDALAAELRLFPNAVYSTYGMTETLSHIALRRLSGEAASEWYTPFEGVTLSADGDGCLVIDAPAVCAERLVTHDRVAFHPDGRRFRILGRIDNVICSGGVKIQAEEVERLLRPYISQPYYVTKTPDPRLGEAVTLVIERRSSGQGAWCKGQEESSGHGARGKGQEVSSVADIRAICTEIINSPTPQLPNSLNDQSPNSPDSQTPKYLRRVVWVNRLPMTETGKPRRSAPLPDDAEMEELNSKQ